MISETDLPAIGSRWKDRDYAGRTLEVQEVDPEAANGRHVMGWVDWPGNGSGPYSVEIEVFRRVWVPVES